MISEPAAVTLTGGGLVTKSTLRRRRIIGEIRARAPRLTLSKRVWYRG